MPMSPPLPTSWVVIPTYNEGATLADLLDALLTGPLPIGCLGVDDGSTDGTQWTWYRWKQRYPHRVQLVRRPQPMGLASAYRLGFQTLLQRQDPPVRWIAQMDADGSHHPSDLWGMLDEAQTTLSDLVIGSRWIPTGQAPGLTGLRPLISRGGSWWTRTRLQLPVADMTSGIKVWAAPCLRETLAEWPPLRVNGFGFQVAMTAIAVWRGARWQEWPITFTAREAGTSKFTIGMMWEALAMLEHLRRVKPRLVVPSTASSWADPPQSLP